MGRFGPGFSPLLVGGGSRPIDGKDIKMVAVNVKGVGHHALVRDVPNHDVVQILGEIDHILIVLGAVDGEVGHAHHG